MFVSESIYAQCLKVTFSPELDVFVVGRHGRGGKISRLIIVHDFTLTERI